MDETSTINWNYDYLINNISSHPEWVIIAVIIQIICLQITDQWSDEEEGDIFSWIGALLMSSTITIILIVLFE